MFVSDWKEEKVYSVQVQGPTAQKKVVADGLKLPNALAIDRMNYKLYWADAHYDMWVVHDAIHSQLSVIYFYFWTDLPPPPALIVITEPHFQNSLVLSSEELVAW